MTDFFWSNDRHFVKNKHLELKVCISYSKFMPFHNWCPNVFQMHVIGGKRSLLVACGANLLILSNHKAYNQIFSTQKFKYIVSKISRNIMQKVFRWYVFSL